MSPQATLIEKGGEISNYHIDSPVQVSTTDNEKTLLYVDPVGFIPTYTGNEMVFTPDQDGSVELNHQPVEKLSLTKDAPGETVFQGVIVRRGRYVSEEPSSTSEKKCDPLFKGPLGPMPLPCGRSPFAEGGAGQRD